MDRYCKRLDRVDGMGPSIDHRYIIPPGRSIQTTNAYWKLRELLEPSLKHIGQTAEGEEVLTAQYRGYFLRFIQSNTGEFSVRFSNYALPALKQELREKVGFIPEEAD